MDIVDRILIDQASIEERIKELGEQISRELRRQDYNFGVHPQGRAYVFSAIWPSI